MGSTILFLISVTFSYLWLSFALPTDILRRTLGDENEPFQFQLDCTGKEQVCDVDCKSILCFGAPRQVQWDPEHASQHRRESYNRLPLASMPQADRESRGIFIPNQVLANAVLTGDSLSIEESVMASSAEGGVGDILYYVSRGQNSAVGSIVRHQVEAHHCGRGKWYNKNFYNFGNAEYCAALMAVPSDHSICTKEKKDLEKTVIDYPFMEQLERGPHRKIMFHMLNPSDKWTHQYYKQPSPKREDIYGEKEGMDQKEYIGDD